MRDHPVNLPKTLSSRVTQLIAAVSRRGLTIEQKLIRMSLNVKI
jgi:hypothetical protein